MPASSALRERLVSATAAKPHGGRPTPAGMITINQAVDTHDARLRSLGGSGQSLAGRTAQWTARITSPCVSSRSNEGFRFHLFPTVPGPSRRPQRCIDAGLLTSLDTTLRESGEGCDSDYFVLPNGTVVVEVFRSCRPLEEGRRCWDGGRNLDQDLAWGKRRGTTGVARGTIEVRRGADRRPSCWQWSTVRAWARLTSREVDRKPYGSSWPRP